MRKRELDREKKYPGIKDARKIINHHRKYAANPIRCEWNKNGCLIALANKRKNYHNISREGKKWLLHRWVFFINYNYLPEEVMHTCDNEHCINPLHLKPGNRILNELDKKNKRRTLSGERNPMSKLTWKKIKKLRKEMSNRKRTIKEICLEYGISVSWYYMIKNNKRWVEYD